MKQFQTSVKALLCVWLLMCAFMQTAVAGTVTGQVQTPSGGGFANATFSFTLTQPALVSGTATIAPATVNCYTDANGNVVGEPNPLAIPTVSANLASGTLAATTYFVKITYIDGTGQTVASPEATLILSSTGTLVVTAPTRQPTGATGYNVYIGTATGTETLQGSVTGTPGSWGNFSQASALGAGSALPGSNTTSCKLRFNDELQPSFVCYDVGLISSSGSTLPGYPQYWYLSGGAGGTVNIGVGTPQSTVCQGSGVSYPQSIVAQPIGNATQSIGGGLDLGTNPFNAGPVTASSVASTGPVSGASVTATGAVGGAQGTFSALVIDAGTATTLTAALSLCPNPGTLLIATALSAASNISVPSTCTLQFVKGGSIATGATVTFSDGYVVAPETSQIFNLTGTGAVAGLIFTRPEWFGGKTALAVNAAYNSLPSTGGTIAFRYDTYISPWISLATEITKTNVELAGAKQPDYNSQTAPTALTGGTILQGPVWVKSDPAGPANGFNIHDLGVDGGSAVCTALFSGVAQQGVFLNNNFSAGSSDGPAFLENARIVSVTTLGQSTSSAVHSVLCDNCDGATINHVRTIFNIYGVVIKGQRYTVNDVDSKGHSTVGMYIKSDSLFGIAKDTNISNVTLEQLASAGDTAGLQIESQVTQIAQATSVTNFKTRGTLFGIVVAGTNTTANDVTISNFNIDTTTSGAAITIGGTVGTSRVVLSNGVINTPATDGILIQTTATDTLVDNVVVTNVAAGNGLQNQGQRTSVSNFKAVTTSAWAVNGTAGTLAASNITGLSNASGVLNTTNMVAGSYGPMSIGGDAAQSSGPHMMWTVTYAGTIPASSSLSVTTPPKSIVIERLTVTLNSGPLSGCTTAPIFTVTDGAHPTSCTIANGTASCDSGVVSTTLNAATSTSVQVNAFAGCVSVGNAEIVALYRMN